MMTKEEILERSRKKKKDEGTEYMMNRGRRYGVMAMSSMFIILAVFNMYQGQDNNQILAIFWAYLGYESYGMYTATHQKKRLDCSGSWCYCRNSVCDYLCDSCHCKVRREQDD